MPAGSVDTSTLRPSAHASATRPDVGRRRPMSSMSSVDLPTPLGPVTTVNEPLGTSAEKRARTGGRAGATSGRTSSAGCAGVPEPAAAQPAYSNVTPSNRIVSSAAYRRAGQASRTGPAPVTALSPSASEPREESAPPSPRSHAGTSREAVCAPASASMRRSTLAQVEARVRPMPLALASGPRICPTSCVTATSVPAVTVPTRIPWPHHTNPTR